MLKIDEVSMDWMCILSEINEVQIVFLVHLEDIAVHFHVNSIDERSERIIVAVLRLSERIVTIFNSSAREREH